MTDALRTIARPTTDGRFEFSVVCRCGRQLGQWYATQTQADDAVVFSHRWHPTKGCPTCESDPVSAARRVARAYRHRSAVNRITGSARFGAPSRLRALASLLEQGALGGAP